MDDLRSFISQSVRSGMTSSSSVGGGSQQQGGGGPRADIRDRRSSSSSRGQQSGGGQHGQVTGMPWSDVNGFSGSYTGEVNSNKVPDGHGFMRYSNGVVEEGLFCNGVYQPPTRAPVSQYGGRNGGDDQGGGVPSSSMSVWSLKSSPTMAFQGGHNVLTGQQHQGQGGASSVMNAPTSVHLGGRSGGALYSVDRQY